MMLNSVVASDYRQAQKVCARCIRNEIRISKSGLDRYCGRDGLVARNDAHGKPAESCDTAIFYGYVGSLVLSELPSMFLALNRQSVHQVVHVDVIAIKVIRTKPGGAGSNNE